MKFGHFVFCTCVVASSVSLVFAQWASAQPILFDAESGQVPADVGFALSNGVTSGAPVSVSVPGLGNTAWEVTVTQDEGGYALDLDGIAAFEDGFVFSTYYRTIETMPQASSGIVNILRTLPGNQQFSGVPFNTSQSEGQWYFVKLTKRPGQLIYDRTISTVDHQTGQLTQFNEDTQINTTGSNPFSIPPNSIFFYQANIGSTLLRTQFDNVRFELTADCNDNGVGDAMDVDPADPDGNGLVSPDCNANGVPDECDASPLFESKIAVVDSASEDRVGHCVAISDDIAVAGSQGDDDGGSDSGAAYIFLRTGASWIQEAKLTADDAASGDLFGRCVSVSGEVAVVGAPLDDDGGASSGSAYAFVRSTGTWTQQAKLTANDAASNDNFGRSVSIDDDTAVVGAPFDDHPVSNSGSAYVFVQSNSTWTEQAKLSADDATADDEFGISAAVSGDTAIVGSWLDDDGGANSGSAYVFVRSGVLWSQQAKLTADDAASGDEFGISVSVNGDTAIVGARGDDDDGANSGSAYVFVRSNGMWTQQDKLIADDGEGGNFFGESVSVSGDIALVGAHSTNGAGTSSGSTYVFVRSAGVWTQTSKLTADDAAAGDEFGISVAIDGDNAVVGAWADDNEAGINSGAAYFFYPANDCNDDGIPDDCQLVGNDCNSDGIPDDCQLEDNDCNENGSPDECEPDQDNDGFIDGCDNCPSLRNPSQTDIDDDGVGDLCDNCPSVSNPGQADSNFDGVGDICPCPMRGDMNDDGVVDGLDIQLMVEKLLS